MVITAMAGIGVPDRLLDEVGWVGVGAVIPLMIVITTLSTCSDHAPISPTRVR